jgi:hypothetical protein
MDKKTQKSSKTVKSDYNYSYTYSKLEKGCSD